MKNPIRPLCAAVLAAVSLTALHAADQPKAAYPTDRCVVSDEKLGEHGKPYVFQYEGREVKLCCKECLKDFKKDPAKYTKQLDEAAAAKTAQK